MAGDDGVLAHQASATLTAAGWSCWTTARRTLVYVSPDALRGAEWVLPDVPLLLGGLPVAWEISARAEPDQVLMAWTAYFTTGTPPEALSAFTLALDARPDPAQGLGGPDSVVAALTAQGWQPDMDHPETTAWDTGLTSCFTLCALPELIEDQDPREGLAGWQAWAEPIAGQQHLWCATFSHSTPHDLVGAFAAALASPAPVKRRVLPEAAVGQITLVLPD
ncbi:SPDY domain containing protein [Streptomyces sp. WAC 06725]|nr:SPDY domain containing protein [Streptomyces sp. WAC 06725]